MYEGCQLYVKNVFKYLTWSEIDLYTPIIKEKLYMKRLVGFGFWLFNSYISINGFKLRRKESMLP